MLPLKERVRRCKSCSVELYPEDDIYYLKNLTRRELLVYCEECAKHYQDIIETKGGEVEIESISCSHCGHKIK